ncbi:putative transcription factor p65 homolog [Ylistrum balloti]|uniref:putative transcription factor p65 homolog n=1 Tax=Ylistrum balloti TaxID=509963 RepID=UPI002905D88B|nr:putative transcription factor p65 homolog [Ylistrum balloti]
MDFGPNFTDEIQITSSELQQLINEGKLNMDNITDTSILNQLTDQSVNIQPPLSAMPTNESYGGHNQAKAGSSRTSNRLGSRAGTKQTTPDGVYVEITEQPKQRGLRFRYECEGRSAGSIPGDKSSAERKTFPTIKIMNYTGTAVVVVSCVTKDSPYEPHPHNLVGRDCKRGVCTLKVKDTSTISFPHLGIQCAKKKDVENNLKQRKEINVDPYQSGFKHMNKAGNIDLNVVRLCFQVFLPDESGKISRIVPPVVSLPIHDKKALNELVICRVDKSSGKAKGGDEVFLLCEKINREDIGIRFYKENDANESLVEWEDYGDFSQNDIHRQYAIVFKTPPYKDIFITRPVEVKMQLKRLNDTETSDPIPFTYMPEDPDPDRLIEKRKRKAETLNSYGLFGDSFQSLSQDDIKQRLKVKATKSRIKQEKPESNNFDLPNYTFDNLGSSAMQTEAPTTVPSSMSVRTADNSGMGSVTVTPTESVRQQLASLPENQQFEILRQLAMNKLQHEAIQKQQQQSGNVQVQSSTTSFADLFQTQNQQPVVQQTNSSSNVLLADVSMQQGLMSGATASDQAGGATLDVNMLQTYLGDQGTNVSFESIEGLSGNLLNISYDPNVAAMENVMSINETNQAIQGLSQSG